MKKEELKKMHEVSTETTEVRESAHKPFTLVKRNDETRIAIGNTIISKEIFKTFKEAEAYIKSKPYELIINATCYIYSLNNNN